MKMIAILFLCSVANAATITLGDVKIEANRAKQVIPIIVSGGDLVAGVNFNLQVGNGNTGPRIVDIDVIGTGTIFADNNVGQSGGGSLLPSIFESITVTQSGTVTADGVLAFVTFETLGLSTGIYPLIASDTRNGPAQLLDEMAVNVLSVTDGRLILITEPASWLGLIFGFVGLTILRCRKER